MSDALFEDLSLSRMRTRRASGITSHELTGQGASNDWLTPKHVIDALGPFDLDVCASEFAPDRCAPRFFTWRADGLAREWGGAFVWCNPPYGPHVGKWLRRMFDHGNGIALVFARTETRAVNPALYDADCSLFIKGRLHFVRGDGTKLGNAGAPSVLFGYGAEARRRLEACSIAGVRMYAR